MNGFFCVWLIPVHRCEKRERARAHAHINEMWSTRHVSLHSQQYVTDMLGRVVRESSELSTDSQNEKYETI